MISLLLKNVNLYVPKPFSPGDVPIEGDKIVSVYNAGLTAMNGGRQIVVTGRWSIGPKKAVSYQPGQSDTK
jgi:hypothetical protein